MNIVFDFGNVLFEWNPERLIAEHYPVPLPAALSVQQFAEVLVNHQDWLDFDLGLIDSGELSLRSGARLNIDAAALQSFVDGIPHVLPLIETSLKSVHALVGRRHRLFFSLTQPIRFFSMMCRATWRPLANEVGRPKLFLGRRARARRWRSMASGGQRSVGGNR